MKAGGLTVWAWWSAAVLTLAAAVAASKVCTPTASEARTKRLKLLYVMEYDCIFDWEPVKLERGVTDEVMVWLLNLQDRLTMTSEQPLGEELMVRLLVTPAKPAFDCIALVHSRLWDINTQWRSLKSQAMHSSSLRLILLYQHARCKTARQGVD